MKEKAAKMSGIKNKRLVIRQLGGVNPHRNGESRGGCAYGGKRHTLADIAGPGYAIRDGHPPPPQNCGKCAGVAVAAGVAASEIIKRPPGKKSVGHIG